MSEDMNLKPVSVGVVPAAKRARQGMRNMQTVSPGNTFVDTLYNGREVTFTAKVIPADKVEKFTFVWAGNERLQDELNPASLSDILPSIKANGQTAWAVGRATENGPLEVADGSRRRAAVILAEKDYKVLVGDLTDEEMEMISIMGNFYKTPSIVERGYRYKRLITKMGSQRRAETHLQEIGEKVSRRVMAKCVKAAELPQDVKACFKSIDDITGDLAEKLHSHAFLNIDECHIYKPDICPYMSKATSSLNPDHTLSPKALCDFLVDSCRTQKGLNKPKDEKPTPIVRDLGHGRVRIEEGEDSLKLDIKEVSSDQRREIEQFVALTLEL